MAKTKQQILEEKIRKALNADQEVEIETVDFFDPNRPKTVLEIDFPILPVNQVATIEGNAGKPIYQMSKWWARRRSSVFRTMLIAGAMKAPKDPIKAGESVWNVYYANHQKKGALSDLKVADIFMGGGTTLVEGSRLGMQMYGNDLNPVAWLVVKNELAQVNMNELKRVFEEVETKLKPQIMPYYSSQCPRGHKGKWLKFEEPNVPIKPFFDELTIDEPSEKQLKKFEKAVSTFEGWKKWYKSREYNFIVMNDDFNPLNISNEERMFYRYWGPEVIYTFWAKHTPCQATGCDHRTPIMTSPVIATKQLSVKYWDHECSSCSEIFDVEQKEARMAPSERLIISENEKRHVFIDKENNFSCPNCSKEENIITFGTRKPKSKKVSLSLLIHPSWLKGSSLNKGGSVTDSVEDTIQWNEERAKNLSFIEVRGTLPQTVTCPDTGVVFSTSKGTVPKRSTITCQSETCGREQDVLTSIKATNKTGPVSMYAQQCYCPECDNNKELYGGRFFAKPNLAQFDAANLEWNIRREKDLNAFWPKSELPYGFMTHKLNGGIPNHGFSHWWKMFNAKQLLIHSQFLKICKQIDTDENVRDVLMGMFQQYLRNQNMFCFWDKGYDKLVPMMSNNNYHPKSTVVENSVFSKLGRGNLLSNFAATLSGIQWADQPYEILSKDYLTVEDEELGKEISGKSYKVHLNDKVKPPMQLDNRSSTDLAHLEAGSFDLVVTDPPFGGLLHYSELADFFYVWLRLGLKEKYPDKFSSEYTLKSLEAVSNPARQPDDPDGFYRRLLTQAWKEANRLLKPGGILAFTFHHSADDPWIDVLESLFEAGFYLEATYPIRSDETKGESGQFGSRTIEYDIIHVCRKRTEEPKKVSWAKMRRQVLRDVRQLQDILQNHLEAGLTESDLQVIKRGKALEYYSKHYGQVFVEEGRDFSVQEALVGINQLLDDESNVSQTPPPLEAEVYTRQFLRIFNSTIQVQRNEMQNYLRGTGISSQFFEDKGWCEERNKVFYMVSPLEFALKYKGKSKKELSYDLDQTLLLIGGAFDNSGINLNDTLNNESFKHHPAIGSLLNWFYSNGGSKEIKNAALKAKKIYEAWLTRNQDKEQKQLELFDLGGGM